MEISMPLLLTTPPTAEPVALADVKAHLRLAITDDDAYITSLITAARRAIESRYGIDTDAPKLGAVCRWLAR